MSDEFNLSVDLFRVVMRAVSTEESRYYLAGVRIDPIEGGGAWLVATDGVIMMLARDEAARAPRPAVVQLRWLEPDDRGYCEECGADDVMPVHAMADRMSFALAPLGEPALLTLTRGTGSAWGGIIREIVEAAKYPNWRAAVGDPEKFPEKDVSGPLAKVKDHGMNGNLLDRIARGEVIKLMTASPKAPVHVLFDSRPNVMGIIMPCKFLGFEKSQAFLTEVRAMGDAALAAAEAAGAAVKR